MNNISTLQSSIKPISGSWFSIYWQDNRHHYWNGNCIEYSDQQWEAAVKELAELGQQYIVMCNVASGEQAIYESKVLPKIELKSNDPLEAVLKAADKYNLKVFMSNDYFKFEYYFTKDKMFLPEAIKARFTIMEELAERYSHHKSFYGWYWAWESCLSPYFSDEFLKYFNDSTAHARTLTPHAKFLTAPYGTKNAKYDKKFISQLDSLDVDIIAYQDTVGCYQMNTDESARAFETLNKAHAHVPKIKLWADIETFDWEGTPNLGTTPLIPTEFSRLEKQLAAVSPFVEKTLVFIFQGLLSNPNSIAYTSYEKAGKLYTDYRNWLIKYHPDMIKNI